MRYIPNLIPKRYRVLESYFKVQPAPAKKNNIFLEVIGWLLGIMFLINALIRLTHPLLSIVLGILGFMLLPPGHKWIEKKMRFRLTTRIKTFAGILLFIIAAPLTNHYNSIDKADQEKLELLAKREKAEKEAKEKAAQQQKDSLESYLQAGRIAIQNKQLAKAADAIDRANRFIGSAEDRTIVENEKINLAASKSEELIRSGKYKLALEEIDALITRSPGNSNLLYHRAICYSRTGRTAEAVQDCKSAMQLGSADAEKLHEKINPIRKRVAYYVTRCCDGSTSSATGRGACSHHGGVCNWNDPVYEEYRKYE